MALCGCDLLTIAPNLLAELSQTTTTVSQKLDASAAADLPLDRIEMNEPAFRWMLNEDAMATDKLSEGIRGFASDLSKLRDLLKTRLKT